MDKKRSIIVEGADATGKSTLVDALSRHYSIYAFRAGPKPIDSEHAEVCMIYQCAWLSKTSCIWDRFTGVSNICNFPALDESDVLMHAHYTKVAMQCAAIVVCVADNFEQHELKFYETTNDTTISPQGQEQVRTNYQRMADTLPGAITYDFKNQSIESLIEELDRELHIRI